MTTAPPETVPGFDPADLEDVRDLIRVEVAAGFSAGDEIAETALESLADYAPDGADEDAMEAYAARLTAEELAAHREAQAGWPEVTDNDRLDGAFEMLERQGIVARQNWTCCQTCGFAEIGEALDEAEEEHGRPMRGFTFFHSQDTDRAVDGGGLMFAYGAVEDSEEATLAVGRRVVDALRSVGFTVRWDGSVNTRIAIDGFDWKRRRP